ncbi:FecCD family ABC transporter permease [Paenirhodobacter populi]|nr:iron chelate uptake ABC transporter family permease subunit [Sinirhodobacter populi]
MSIVGHRILRIGPVALLWHPRAVAVGLVLMALCLTCGVLLLGSGSSRLPPGEILAGLMGSSDNPVANRLVWRIRLPRVLTAALTGAALGLAGAVFQSLSRNPLGSPDVIGFTTGAASGAITAIILFTAGPVTIAIAAVASGVATAATVLILARGRRGGTTGGYRLILVGVGVGAVLSGLNTLLLTMGDLERAMSAQIWLAGSLEGRTFAHVATGAAGLAIFAPVVVLCIRRLSMMEMGDDMASQLGVPVGATRILLVVASVGLTSIATACTGPIAFVALAGPQLARRLTRAAGAPLLTGAMMGALLMILADLIGQNAPLRLVMPIGLTTGFLGGLYLLVVLGLSRR